MASDPNRIREIRLQRGLTQKALGDRVGLSGAQISRLENGERPLSVPYMERLARSLNCAPSDLLLDSVRPPGAMATAVADESSHGFEFADPATPYAKPWPISLLGESAAWSPHGCIYFDQHYLETFGLNPVSCRVVRVLDSSMGLKLPTGSLCLVDTRRNELEDGIPFAFIYQGAPIIRQARQSGSSWVLAADDGRYPYIPLTDDVTLVGQVIWFCAVVEGAIAPPVAGRTAA